MVFRRCTKGQRKTMVLFTRRKEVINISDNTMFVNYPDVVSIEDLQSMLRIGRNAAYDLIRNGIIKTIRIGKKYIIPKKSVIAFLEI